jgi:hypothetical protein
VCALEQENVLSNKHRLRGCQAEFSLA